MKSWLLTRNFKLQIIDIQVFIIENQQSSNRVDMKLKAIAQNVT
jgi:hypothetical protein